MDDNIKLVIFDLDGVLVDAKEIHRDTFIQAVKEIANLDISHEIHEKELCGRPTKVKLNILGVIPALHSKINERKQALTREAFKKLPKDVGLIDILRKLSYNYYVACCSNSMRKTVEIALDGLGIINFFDVYLGNDDVIAPKPSPEMYFKAMAMLAVKPRETLVIEDSPVGIETIINSGARGLFVKSRKDVTYERIIGPSSC